MRTPRELTGTRVAMAFVAFFLVVIGVNAIMLHAATSTFGGVAVEGAYRLGLEYNKEIAAAERQDALKWKAVAHVARRGDGLVAVTVGLTDAAGVPPADIRVTAHLIHPADARHDHHIGLVERAPGRFAGEADAQPGRWDLEIEAIRQEDVLFRSRSRLTLD